MSTVIDVYRYPGVKVTPEFLQSLEAEGIQFDSGGRWLTVRAKGLKGKPIYATNLIRVSRGRLIITKNRLVAIGGGRRVIDIPRDHPLFKNLVFDKSNPKRYTISLDLSQLPGGRVGQLSYSYHFAPSAPSLP
jgi:hypothetical protein